MYPLSTQFSWHKGDARCLVVDMSVLYIYKRPREKPLTARFDLNVPGHHDARHVTVASPTNNARDKRGKCLCRMSQRKPTQIRNLTLQHNESTNRPPGYQHPHQHPQPPLSSTFPHLTTFLHYFPASPVAAVASPPPSSLRTSPHQHCRPLHRLQTQTPRTARTACDRKSDGAHAVARRRRTGQRR